MKSINTFTKPYASSKVPNNNSKPTNLAQSSSIGFQSDIPIGSSRSLAFAILTALRLDAGRLWHANCMRFPLVVERSPRLISECRRLSAQEDKWIYFAGRNEIDSTAAFGLFLASDAKCGSEIYSYTCMYIQSNLRWVYIEILIFVRLFSRKQISIISLYQSIFEYKILFNFTLQVERKLTNHLSYSIMTLFYGCIGIFVEFAIYCLK